MRDQLLPAGWGYATITDKIADIVLRRPVHWVWALGFVVSGLLCVAFVGAMGYLFATGVGIWGVNIPVAWGFAISNFVWWIGIGHAGTFISAFLLLLRQKWRNSINRFAEAMTLFAAGIAGLWPILLLRRPWIAYLLAPIPHTMEKSPPAAAPPVTGFFPLSPNPMLYLFLSFSG